LGPCLGLIHNVIVTGFLGEFTSWAAPTRSLSNHYSGSWYNIMSSQILNMKNFFTKRNKCWYRIVCYLFKCSIIVSGAYELPKENATYAVRRVPSQSKFKTHYYLISFLIWKVVLVIWSRIRAIRLIHPAGWTEVLDYDWNGKSYGEQLI